MHRLPSCSPRPLLPFTGRKHPDAARANDEATAWIVQHGLITDAATDAFAGIAFGHLAARGEPEASYEDLLLLAQWLALAFVLDDQHDHLIRHDQLSAWQSVEDAITRTLDHATPRQPHRNPLTRAFADLYGRIRGRLEPTAHRRFTAHFRNIMESLNEEARNRAPNSVPTITDYILLRRHSSQIPAILDLSEAALNVEVAPEIRASPIFQELYWSAIDVISWTNDIFSFPKEQSCGDTNNLPVLLCAQHRCRPEEAIRMTEQRILERLEDFDSALQRLPRTMNALDFYDPLARSAALQMAYNLQDWMIGGDVWQRQECTRYHDERWNSGGEGAYNRPTLLTERSQGTS
ncbi:terpene synthase family protein [Streptomyces buecherae]|uniref:terpene synthase family protein n=1 Tax=Streptomyces buecherae TaxID=2763006 RepID=UPI0036553526